VSQATLRRASRADRAALRALHRALYIDHHGSIVPPSIAPLLEYRDFERVLRGRLRQLAPAAHFATA